MVKQSFDSDFVNLMEDLYKKYGEEVFSIQGIANKHLDIVKFSKEFFGKSSNVASVSVDSNANVNEKNVTQYTAENNKALMRLNSIALLHKEAKKEYGQEVANDIVDKVVGGEVFINDLHAFYMPYCYAFDCRELLANGMNFFHGNMNIKPPKRSDSFIALIIQSVASISNMIAGASSFPDFFVCLDKFYRAEFGEDYMDNGKLRSVSKEDNNVKRRILDQFQNLIFSLNFPFRSSGQSAFTNLSVMDKGFMDSLFDGYIFPDFTFPNIESSIELSKMFFEYFESINCKEGIFTFPVMTHAISLDENNEYMDNDFVDWSSKVNSGKSLANIFQSTPNSFSSCCRLKNEYEKVGGDGFQNSFGVGGLSIGSHRVSGLNLPRLSLLEKENKNAIDEALEVCHKILYVHRKLIKKRIEGGFIPLYDANWINIDKQYSTIGLIGLYEYLQNKGKDINNDKDLDESISMLTNIESKISEWQTNEKNEKCIYNIEMIPGESVAVRLASIDKELGYNPNNIELYSNQYISLMDEAPISKRLDIQGKLDQHTSGGAILHLSMFEEKPLSSEQMKRIMDEARKRNVVYFAFNYCYSEDEKGRYIIGKHEKSPIDDSEIVNQYTRVVGFVTKVSAWNKTRKDYEYPNRKSYKEYDLNVN